MIVCRVPLRISFFGGGTDYPAWYREHGGCVLSTSIDKYCYVTSRYLPPFFDHMYRITYSQIEHVKTLDEIVHPAIRESIRLTQITEGLEIRYDADLPARTGLGSSSSFVVGLLHSLYTLIGRTPTKEELALDAIKVEQEMLGEAVGSQDQCAAAYGGFNWIDFGPSDSIVVTPVSTHADRLNELNDHMLLFYSGVSRFASEVAQEQIQKTQSNANQLHEMSELAYEARVLLEGSSPLEDFGKLLHETWKLKRSLSSKISTSIIDEMYATAMNAGALGGKLLGAGGGGFLLIFAKPEFHARIKESLKSYLSIGFKFDNTGSKLLYVHRDG